MFFSNFHLVRTVLITVAALGSLSVGAKPYKGAEIFTNDSQLYGKYVFRMRAAEGSGILSNFFLWKEGSELPGVAWEEVDIEVFGRDQARSWQSNIITGLDSRSTSEQVHDAGVSLAQNYHTYSIEWTPQWVRWRVDGELVRETQGGQTGDLINPAQARFNFWPPNIPSWVGPWNDSILPVHMYVNWVEYHRWNGAGFTFEWRDDFNTFDSSRWGLADWTFAENRADFSPANVQTVNGYLVLSMTREGQEGFNSFPPADSGSGSGSSSSSSSGSSGSSGSSSSSSSGSSSGSSSSSSSGSGSGGDTYPVISGGQSGNFNTTGTYGFRTQDSISGWGVANFSGRSISVTVNGSGNAVTTPGAPLPPKSPGDYYFFEATAGDFPWASVYWW